MRLNLRVFASALLVCVLGLLVQVSALAQNFLEAEQAFPVAVTGNGQQWVVEFRVADGYYLYRDKLDIQRPDTVGSATPFTDSKRGAPGSVSLNAAVPIGAQPVFELPAGQRKFDENLSKEVETLRQVVRIPVTWTDAPPAAVDIHSQGCADAGLCYPPMVQRVKLNTATAAFPASALPGASADASGDLANRLQSGNTLWVLLAFFGLGVLLAFTPCVLPMVPILSAVIVGQTQASTSDVSRVAHVSSPRWRSVALASAYVGGMSLVYTAVGVVAGLTGEGLVAAMQQPTVLFTFAGFLLVFGIAMLGAWEMQLPLAIQNWVNERSARLQGGRFTPVFVMGGLSAVLVGPCVAPPLAGALLYLSTTGDWVLGGAALLALSWGLGAPLIVAAAAADRVLPRAGAWMESVKRFFGFLLIALAIYTTAPVVPTPVLMAAWSIFLLISAAWAGALQVLPVQASAGARLRQGFAWVLLLAGVLQGIGASSGARDVFMPLSAWRVAEPPSSTVVSQPPRSDSQALSKRSDEGSAVVRPAESPGMEALPPVSPRVGSGSVVLPPVSSNPHGLPFRRVSAGEAEAVIARLGQAAFLDFYADWCVACKEMERFTFTDPSVQRALANVVWLQVDVTANTAEDKALLKRFRLFGPPGIVFFDVQGREVRGVRVVGFQSAQQFVQTVGIAFPGP